MYPEYALAPTIAASLLVWAGGSWAISLYILGMAVFSFVCILFLSETYLTDMSEIRSEEKELLADEGKKLEGGT
jgi:low affinity Fe/Cu permease